jgi:glycosyltransferase involved in cell wall biosynthesis
LEKTKNPFKKIILIIFFKILYLIQQFLYKSSDKLIFLQKKGLENAKKYQNKSMLLFQIYRKINYNLDGYIDQEFEGIRKKYRYLFCFAGGITVSYAIKEIVLAFKYLDNNKFGFVMFGGGDYLDEILKTIRENNIQNVFYLGFKRKELIRNYYLGKADFLVIPSSFEKEIEFSFNKLIDYLEQRKPIIVVGYNLLDILNEVGFIIEDKDPETIAYKLTEIVNIDSEVIKDKVNKGYEYLVNELDYRVAAKKLYEFIKD